MSRNPVTARRTFLTLALSSLALAVAPLAYADDASAQAFVTQAQGDLFKAVRAGKPDSEADKVFDRVLDYQVLAESALRDHWQGLKDAERQEFVKLLSQLVRNSYRKNLKKTLGYAIEYKGTSPADGGELVLTVATSSTDKREEPMTIDYLVSKKSGTLRIVDVVTEGSSMVANYRSSFNRIMKKGGFPDLIKRMQKKAASGGGGAD